MNELQQKRAANQAKENEILERKLKMENLRAKGVDHLLDLEMNSEGPNIYAYKSLDFTRIDDMDFAATKRELISRKAARAGAKHWAEDVQALTRQELEVNYKNEENRLAELKQQLLRTKKYYAELQQSNEREDVEAARIYPYNSSFKQRERMTKYTIPFELEDIIKPMIGLILARTN
jgi:hypothetical protein